MSGLDLDLQDLFSGWNKWSICSIFPQFQSLSFWSWIFPKPYHFINHRSRNLPFFMIVRNWSFVIITDTLGWTTFTFIVKGLHGHPRASSDDPKVLSGDEKSDKLTEKSRNIECEKHFYYGEGALNDFLFYSFQVTKSLFNKLILRLHLNYSKVGCIPYQNSHENKT